MSVSKWSCAPVHQPVKAATDNSTLEEENETITLGLDLTAVISSRHDAYIIRKVVRSIFCLALDEPRSWCSRYIAHSQCSYPEVQLLVLYYLQEIIHHTYICSEHMPNIAGTLGCTAQKGHRTLPKQAKNKESKK